MSAAKPSQQNLLGESVGKRLDASPLVIMLDVDGTLAPIAPTPWQAEVPEATRAVVQRLAAMPRVTVAFVSGRSASDAWRLAGVPGAWVIGNHGLELRNPDGTISADDRVIRFEDAIHAAATVLADELSGLEGAIVEDKRWTLSVHYRLVKPPDVPWLIARAEHHARALGLRVLEGKMIVELRPSVEVDKGTASVAFASRVGASGPKGAILYAGDDRTDEDAFRALRSVVAESVTLRIATTAEQRQSASSAEFVLRTTEELREVLEWLAARRAAVERSVAL